MFFRCTTECKYFAVVTIKPILCRIVDVEEGQRFSPHDDVDDERSVEKEKELARPR